VFIGSAGMVFLIGLLWEAGKSGMGHADGRSIRVLRQLAWVAVLLSFTIILQTFAKQGFLTIQSQALAYGIFHLGLIRLWYTWKTKNLPAAAVLSPGQQIGWFAAGILVVQPGMYFDPTGITAFLWIFPAAVCMIYVHRLWRPSYADISLYYAAGLVGSGALFQFYSRNFLFLPPNPWIWQGDLADAQQKLFEKDFPVFSMEHVSWLFAMIVGGAFAGWCASRIRLPGIRTVTKE
jgi:hypothetical protein